MRLVVIAGRQRGKTFYFERGRYIPGRTDGATWSRDLNAPTGKLGDICGASAENCIVSANYGRIYRRTTAGWELPYELPGATESDKGTLSSS